MVTKVDLLIILAGIVSIAVIAIRFDGRLRGERGTGFVRAAAIAISLMAVGVLLAVRASLLPEWTLAPPFVAWLLMVTYPESFQRALERARRGMTPP